jgi:hypothetical protein
MPQKKRGRCGRACKARGGRRRTGCNGFRLLPQNLGLKWLAGAARSGKRPEPSLIPGRFLPPRPGGLGERRKRRERRRLCPLTAVGLSSPAPPDTGWSCTGMQVLGLRGLASVDSHRPVTKKGRKTGGSVVVLDLPGRQSQPKSRPRPRCAGSTGPNPEDGVLGRMACIVQGTGHSFGTLCLSCCGRGPIL